LRLLSPDHYSGIGGIDSSEAHATDREEDIGYELELELEDEHEP
jgi:hypothetical protein